MRGNEAGATAPTADRASALRESFAITRQAATRQNLLVPHPGMGGVCLKALNRA
jgi:hypothetical protein